MYFVTYQYASFSEAGVLSEDRQKVIPLSTIGMMLGRKLPETMVEFIQLENEAPIAAIAEVLREHPNMGIKKEMLNLLAPIPKPERNIFCLGKNYADHAQEIKHLATQEDVPESPIYFSKLSSSVTGPDSIIMSHVNATKQVDYEVELAIIIGKKGENISKRKAEEHIFGYTVANDITARDLQRKHSQWYKGKSLDTFCPLGPGILHKSALPLPFNLKLDCRVNGVTMQSSYTDKMIFDIPTIINDLSQGMTLYPGDIILTGTPAGVGAAQDPPLFLKRGDIIESEIEKIGLLRNRIQ
ncbi:MAG: fumarylacetoacetate hydrolase family protein [Eubacteriaceae bacterium]|jgi:2-keto-4-pentenoate hydratase/2-oxohepta-3-ene-1,7-dioic acid hydratase in catechol pathway|nr:fumarylacetoacetate hydrolase family protein [Eubacteriaceae bacterium]